VRKATWFKLIFIKILAQWCHLRQNKWSKAQNNVHSRCFGNLKTDDGKNWGGSVTG
jgi:hypothetical protein